jgi:hypothetical protein
MICLRPILFLACIVVMTSCERTPSTLDDSRFAYESFMQNQTLSLNADHTGLRKTITINGKRETRHLNDPDWTQELAPLLDLKFNQNSWNGAFDCDTVQKTNRISLQYHATDPGIALRELICSFSKRDTMITARTERSNLWFTLQKTMHYNSRSGYSFTIVQKTRFGNTETTVVEGRFGKNSTP